MAIQLRPYQEEAVAAVRGAIVEQSRAGLRPSVILESPTGSGKTAMASFMTHSNVAKGGSAAFICHRRELLDQTAETFERAGIDYGFIASGMPKKTARAQICSVGTLVNRVQQIEAPKLVIWDECHHIGAETWGVIRDAWKDSIHIGLTATPRRLDGKGLGKWFRALVPGPRVKDLMGDGFLSTYDAYAPVIPTMAGMHKRGGDYVRGELESALDTGEILGGIVDNWLKLAEGKKTIGFAITVKHSEDIVARFIDSGVRAAHLDANTPTRERKLKLQAFARGEIQVLFNVDLFGEGFDLAANSGMDVNIEAVILARPTASLGLHLQQVGRGLRPKPEPCVILDHAGNLLRHGMPEDERVWSLEDDVITESQPSAEQCAACFALIPRHVMVCPYCGTAVVKAESPRTVTEVEGDLERIVNGARSKEQLALELRTRRQEVLRATTLESLSRIEKSRGLPAGWAARVLSERAKAAANPGRRF